MRPDKKKVIDEVWDDERVKSFLDKGVPSQSGQAFDGDADFYVLLNAYYAMRADDFGRFLSYYTASGRSLTAQNATGQTLSEYLRPHKKAGPFIEVLTTAIKSGLKEAG